MLIVIVLSIVGFVMFFPVLLSVISLLLYMIFFVIFKIKEKIFKNKLEIDISYSLPDYEPAIAGYLVDNQRIGQKEVLTTLFDLVSRGVIDLVKDNSTFHFKLKEYNTSDLENFEDYLILWLFKNKKEITSEDIKQELFDRNSKEDMNFFLSKLQGEAKLNNFFSKKISKIKEIICTIITANSYIMTHIYTVSFYIAYTLILLITKVFDDVIVGGTGENITGGVLKIFEYNSIISWGLLLLIPVALYLINKGINALLTGIYNILCYYNEYSENGYKEYCKLMGLKQYLETYSLISEHPIESLKIWDRYYLFAIELNCSDKFFKQLKESGFTDSFLDLDTYEFYEFLISNIKDSFNNPPKDVFTDIYGGSHVKY